MPTWKSITANFTDEMYLYFPDWLTIPNFPGLTADGIIIYAFVLNDIKDSIRSGKFTGEDKAYSVWTIHDLAQCIHSSEGKIRKGLHALEDNELIKTESTMTSNRCKQIVIYPQLAPYLNPPASYAM